MTNTKDKKYRPKQNDQDYDYLWRKRAQQLRIRRLRLIKQRSKMRGHHAF